MEHKLYGNWDLTFFPDLNSNTFLTDNRSNKLEYETFWLDFVVLTQEIQDFFCTSITILL